MNKSHHLRRFVFNEKDSFIQVRSPKPRQLPGWIASFPTLLQLRQRLQEALPVSPSRGPGRRGRFIGNLGVGLGFIFRGYW